MKLAGLVNALTGSESFQRAVQADGRDHRIHVGPGLTAATVLALAKRSPRAMLVVTATGREADQLAEVIRHGSTREVLEFPAWETLPHERLSPSVETVGRRLDVMRRLSEASGTESLAPIVIASVRAALQPVNTDPKLRAVLTLRSGDRGLDLRQLAAELVEKAYVRVDMVTRRGEFAVRGGILDVFPPLSEHPMRLEFFGDELEQIRAFSVADQRSLDDEVKEVGFTPAREMLLTETVQSRARDLIEDLPGLSSLLERIANGIPVEGMESLSSALCDGIALIPELFAQRPDIIVVHRERVESRAAQLVETNREFLEAAWHTATLTGATPVDPAVLSGRLRGGEFATISQLHESTIAGPDSAAWTDLVTFDDGSQDVLRLPSTAVNTTPGDAEGMYRVIGERLRDGWRVVVAAAGHGLLERVQEQLADHTLAARMHESLPEELEPGVAHLVQVGVPEGFQFAEGRVMLVSEADLFGRTSRNQTVSRRRLAGRRGQTVDPLALTPGDYVVHETHGIGRFVELVSRTVQSGPRSTAPARLGEAKQVTGVVREYVVLEYGSSKRGSANDRLYVPTDQLDLLSRYVGGEAPTLSKLGGSDWAATKGRARKAVREIAVELVKLYAARMSAKGHQFGPDTPWQRELEEAFAFVETRDQLQTIDEVKADMERPIPMDRLLAGDVGFGKTEVAVRAAFKAVQDGKQVAMLVPTTLLVKQHLETFSDRYAPFPVRVAALSRFQTPTEARNVIEGLADGSIDVVIGTHRILTESVKFKDLGLVIIDEEQRFGVEHKDKLKQLKTNVDVLAMSATPIPRTLEMAVTGIREMSTLATPPEDRLPILTFVGPYSAEQVAAAIRRELMREGQVFFVHNRVASIERTAAAIAELVPEARVAVAHGQMSEAELEQIVDDFWERRVDVLVSTTIIETGLDIANANTIIIDRADKYGLSQLHQLRGRVGRSRERAYAYFLYDAETGLTATAQDRLETIAANNELGSGMRVALKDLEIRGAGNLLGAEQAGHIAGVGFDLYLRMIGEAVTEFREGTAPVATELRIELPVDARIPEDYIESERLRLEAYQKLSAASSAAASEDAITSVLDELTDRYGQPSPHVQRLVEIAKLRRHAAQVGLSEIVSTGSRLRIFPAELPDSRRVRLERLYPGAKVIASQQVALVDMPGDVDDESMIAWAHGLLESIWPLSEVNGTTADTLAT